eukprot:TRINITY_DN6370_c0_g2_i2.p1 TRINITY_DN6370_c0_g2~~TRINITY_DN6370_c0_g2_i2.p1  ORF type:complete len:2259 (+),score=461.38 TRINITY_DN6370_c0_g2_i2:50-6826(+)
MYSLRDRDLSYLVDGDEASLAARAAPWTKLRSDEAHTPRSPRSTPRGQKSSPAPVGHGANDGGVQRRNFAVKLADAKGTYSQFRAAGSRRNLEPSSSPAQTSSADLRDAVSPPRPSSAPSAVFSPRSFIATPRELLPLARPEAVSANTDCSNLTGLSHERAELEHLRKENAELKAANKDLKERFDKRGVEMSKLHDRLRKLEKEKSNAPQSKEPQAVLPIMLRCTAPCCIPLGRLEKAGLNVEALSQLDAKWAGYTFSLLSSQVKSSGSTLSEVFRKHKDLHAKIDEAAFRTFIKHFMPTMTEERVTRLFYFADTDGSGELNFLEFLRLFGIDVEGKMGEEYFEHVMVRTHKAFNKNGGIAHCLGLNDKIIDGPIPRQKVIDTLTSVAPFLTRAEVWEVTSRFLITGDAGITGKVELRRFNDAMKLCASSSFVTEDWVSKLFKQVSTSLQRDPVNLMALLRSLGPGVEEHGWVGREDLRVFLRHFEPNLRNAQIDRVFAFICAGCHSGQMGRFALDHLIQVICRPTLGPPQPRIGGDHGTALPMELVSRAAVRLEGLCGSLSQAFDNLNPCLCYEEFCAALQSLGFGAHMDFERLFTKLDVHRMGKVSKMVFMSVLDRHTRQSEENEDEVNEEDKKISALMEGRVQYFSDMLAHRKSNRTTVAMAVHEELLFDLQRAINRILVLETELEFRRREEDRSSEVRIRRNVADEKRELEIAHSRLIVQLRELIQEKSASEACNLDSRQSIQGQARERAEGQNGEDGRDNLIQELHDEVEMAKAEKVRAQEELMDMITILQDELVEIRQHSEDMSAAGSQMQPGQGVMAPAGARGTIGPKAARSSQGSLQAALSDFSRKRDITKFVEKVRGVSIAGRFVVKSILTVESDSLVLKCADAFKKRDVAVKMPIHDAVKTRTDFLRECCIYTVLSEVSVIQDVLHFPGLSAGLAYCVMELLEGRLLAQHLESIRSGQEAPLPAHDAAEICDALLHGIEACHDYSVTHLDIKPSVVWEVAQPACVVVKILDFGLARLTNLSLLPPEARQFFRPASGEGAAGRTEAGTGPELELDDGSAPLHVPQVPSTSDGSEAWSSFAPYASLSSTGSPWYMSPSRLCGFTNLWQRKAVPQPRLHMAKTAVESSNMWVESDDETATDIAGLRQVSPVSFALQGAVTCHRFPEGHYFEVILRKVWSAHMLTVELDSARGMIGMAAGFTPIPPEEKNTRDGKIALTTLTERAKDWPVSWVVGYDGRFYQNGEEIPPREQLHPYSITDFRRRRTMKLRSHEGAHPDTNVDWPAGPMGWSFGELLRDDCVGLLAEDAGFLTTFVNGHMVSRLKVDGINDCGPLYPLVELCGVVREIGVPSSPKGPGGEEEQAARQEAKEAHVDVIESLATKALSPYADIYAAAMIAMEIFQSAHIPAVPQAFVRLLMNTQLWLSQGRPAVAEHNGLLTTLSAWEEASKELVNTSGRHLMPHIAEVIDRVFMAAGTGKPGSAIKTAQEFRKALNERTATSHVDSAFLRSHLFQGVQLKGKKKNVSLNAPGAQEDGIEERSVTWDLTPWSLSSSHIRRVLVVLQSTDSNHIGAVSIARLDPNVPDELQLRLAECFVGRVKSQNSPSLWFRQAVLPADDCPVPFSQLAEANAAGLILRFVRRLDMGMGTRTDSGKPTLSGPAIARMISGALHGNKTLEELKANSQNFGDEGTALIGKALCGSGLLHLELIQSNITEVGLQTLAQALMEPGSKMRYLELACNDLGCIGCCHLAEMLKVNRSLEILGIQRNNIGAKGAMALAEALALNCILQELDLGRNSVGTAGAHALAGATRVNSVLRKLNLQDNDLELVAGLRMAEELSSRSKHEQDAQDPSTSMRYTNAVKRATIFGCEMGDAPISTSLRVLNLRHNHLGSVGAASLLAALQTERTQIVELNLAWNGLGLEAAAALASMLGHQSYCILQHLDLRDNKGLGQGVLSKCLARLASSSDPEKSSRSRRRASMRRSLGDISPQEKKDPLVDAARHLRWLNLANTDMDGESLAALAPAMAVFTQLEELYLYNNCLGLGAHTIENTLQTQDREEAQRRSAFADPSEKADSEQSGLCVFVKVLPPTLKILSLGSCHLGAGLVTKVLKSLAQYQLEELCLSDNEMGAGQADGGNGKIVGSIGEQLRNSICSFIEGAQKLKKLDLSLNLLGEQVVLDVVTSLCNEAPTVSVDFCANALSEEIVKVLRVGKADNSGLQTIPVPAKANSAQVATQLQECLEASPKPLGDRLRV